MGTLNRITSYFTYGSQGAGNQDSAGSKFTRVAGGLGAAALAVVSWKIIAAGALAYSAYRGGIYLHGRYFKKDEPGENSGISSGVDAVNDERPVYTVTAGHDAHSDTQDERREQPPVLVEQVVEEVPQAPAPVQHEDNLMEMLQKMKMEAKGRAGKNTLEAIITHPDLMEKAKDPFWLKKMALKHGRWMKRTGGLSLYAVQAYRKIKQCLPKTVK